MEKVELLKIEAVSKQILAKCAVPERDAQIIADSIIYAHSRGKGTHGITRLPIYEKKIKNGSMRPDTKLTVVKDTPIVSVFDANHGFGQVAGAKGIQICIEKAEKHGLGVVGIRNSNNFGTAGYIVEKCAEQKMIGIVLANSGPAIAPSGGKKPLLGTNPIGVAFPKGGNQFPIVLDMATSVISRGKIRLAAKNEEKIPFGWALDSDGNPTDDPIEAIKGSMIPIGGHKGYGLSLAVDILAGLLTGSAFGGEVKPLGYNDGYSRYGHMLIAINISFFMEMEEYAKNISTLYENVKQCGERDRIFLPGEKSYRNSLLNTETVEINANQINEINSLAERLNLDCRL